MTAEGKKAEPYPAVGVESKESRPLAVALVAAVAGWVGHSKILGEYGLGVSKCLQGEGQYSSLMALPMPVIQPPGPSSMIVREAVVS